jgi:hypothetical protein
MKPFAIGAIALCAATAAAANPSLRFEAKIEVPALSLLDQARQNPLPVLNDAAEFFRRASLRAATAPKYVGRMPVLTPAPSTDFKMRIATPDETVDHKLIVKTPEVELSR